MNFRRIVLLSGHYGSGKTNIAVNIASCIRQCRDKVVLADLDIVNPYFRAADSRKRLAEAGIRLICSEFASSNVDLPALPQEMYAVTDDRSLNAVIDVGGDDRGALALGRWRDAILRENDYEMLFVINCFRPLTRTVDDTLEIMREIEYAAGMRFTAVVNNSNLAGETTADTVLGSMGYARGVSDKAGIPLKMNCVPAYLYDALRDRIPLLFPLTLQEKII